MLISLMHRQQEEEAIRYHGNGDPPPPPNAIHTLPLHLQAAHGDVMAALLQYKASRRVPQTVMQARSVTQ